MKFRKKPVVVKAVQWDGPWILHPGIGTENDGKMPNKAQGVEVRFYVTTIHGQRAYLASGDWIIAEPDGIHYYPCKPDIFEATYEPVEE